MNTENSLNIAIIGAGASGVSTAYELLHGFSNQKQSAPNTAMKVTIFEKSNVAGGRAQQVEFAGQSIEIGATIIHSKNHYIAKLMEYTQAKRKQPDLAGGGTEYYGFWDGGKVYKIFNPAAWYFPLRMGGAFGVNSALRFSSVAKKCIGKWLKLYNIQQRRLSDRKIRKLHKNWHNVSEFLDDTKLHKLANRTYAMHNKINGVGKKWTYRFAEPILNNMFNQDANINALSGNIALAGAGLGGELFQIEGGNGNLFGNVCEKLAKEHKLALKFNSEIAKMRVFNDHIKLQCLNSKTWLKFDKVVLATPLELANIEIEFANVFNETKKQSENSNKKAKSSQKAAQNNSAHALTPASSYNLKSNYSNEIEKLLDESLKSDFYALQKVYVTLVEGEINRDYFNLKPNKPLPTTIFCRANVGLPYKSVGITGYSDRGMPIYKIFSASPLSPELLPQMFTNIAQTKTYYHRGAFNLQTVKRQNDEENRIINDGHRFELLQNLLYYPNAIEHITTTLEVAAVMGVNAAHLITKAK